MSSTNYEKSLNELFHLQAMIAKNIDAIETNRFPKSLLLKDSRLQYKKTAGF